MWRENGPEGPRRRGRSARPPGLRPGWSSAVYLASAVTVLTGFLLRGNPFGAAGAVGVDAAALTSIAWAGRSAADPHGHAADATRVWVGLLGAAVIVAMGLLAELQILL